MTTDPSRAMADPLRRTAGPWQDSEPSIRPPLGSQAEPAASSHGLGAPANAVSLPPDAVHLLENGPPMYMASLDGCITYGNEQYRRLQRVMAERRTDVVPCEATPAFAIHDVIHAVVSSGCAIQREEVLENGADTEFYSSQHYPIRDKSGGVVAVGGVYQNATREARAWLQTLAARDRFRDVARLVSDWIWETDAALNFTYLSPRAADVLQLNARHLLGTSLFSLGTFRPSPDGIPQPFPDRNMRTAFRNALFETRAPDGKARLFLLSGLPLFDEATDAFKGFRGTARDITEEMAARKIAERSQRRLADAIENIAEGFALRDVYGRLVLCNSKFRDVFATIADDVAIKTPFTNILDAAKRAALTIGPAGALDAWLGEVVAGRSLASPLELQLKDGRWIKITESGSTRGGVLSILSDITEMKQREAALIAAKQMAERASHSKGEFLANMSHELRTPLNAIIGFSEIMQSETFGPLGNHRYVDYVKDIHDSSRHLLGVINDILDISKGEAGKLQLNESAVDLSAEVRNMARLFTEQALAGEVTLDLDLPESLPRIWADGRKIKQVLLNLLSNAIKFTPAGGHISVTARRDTGVGGDLLITVADTGIGIDENDIGKVFSVFGQVESSLSRRYAGTGLGLPLSRGLVEMHGGQLTLASKVGVGTTAMVRLPASRLRP